MMGDRSISVERVSNIGSCYGMSSVSTVPACIIETGMREWVNCIGDANARKISPFLSPPSSPSLTLYPLSLSSPLSHKLSLPPFPYSLSPNTGTRERCHLAVIWQEKLQNLSLFLPCINLRGYTYMHMHFLTMSV